MIEKLHAKIGLLAMEQQMHALGLRPMLGFLERKER
jgi:hypothetical protein